MPRFQIDGVWYDAENYAAARVRAALARPVAVPVAPVVKPVVNTVSGVLTPVAGFPNRSMVRFGIGERINLSFVTLPPGQTAASFGGLDWFVRSGPATIAQDGGHVGTGQLTCGTTDGIVMVELRTVNPPVTVKARKQFAVIRPDDVVFAQRPGSGDFHRHGRPSAGFQAVTYLRPADVSFRNLEFREGGASYVGTGIFARREASLAQLGSSYNTIHPVRADWSNVDGGDSSVNGSMVSGYDTVSTNTGVVGVGTFTWSIPQLARVVGTMDDFNVKTLDHVVTIDAAGTMTISKGGVAVTHHLADADSDY